MHDHRALKIYTDGSAYNNPGGSGGIAAIAEFPEELSRDSEVIFKKGFTPTTNNRMELQAVMGALIYIRENGKQLKICRAVVVTDSKYVYENYNRAQNWKDDDWRGGDKRPIENVDLWEEFLKLRQKTGVRTDIQWIKGKKTEITKEVDRLAKMAAKDILKSDGKYKVGKIARSKVIGREAAIIFAAFGQEEAITIYRKRLVAKGEHKIFFNLLSEEGNLHILKCFAYAAEDIAVKLHRSHSYNVHFNNNPKYPIIEFIISEKKVDTSD